MPLFGNNRTAPRSKFPSLHPDAYHPGAAPRRGLFSRRPKQAPATGPSLTSNNKEMGLFIGRRENYVPRSSTGGKVRSFFRGDRAHAAPVTNSPRRRRWF
ncbi:hypothetical protein BZG36_03593 [Bifiguratus adelaidae]|uniref:Uncharacterized protein n=1 Tax=Bifiguratus adelaidae TaxID=1938954 RepID=A0A261XYK7_9FUNG|nr:hypothetical protein BZG36_03593 [Bifiguratus adelaidae]